MSDVDPPEDPVPDNASSGEEQEPANQGEPSATPGAERHVSARVPESVSTGVLSTGVIVMTGANEFVVDFIQGLGQPAQVAARVVVPHSVMPQFVDALKRNLEIYKQRYGDPPQLPQNPNSQQRQPSAQEIYDELKITDDVLAGSYANGVMIGHSMTEFKLDFLANLFPHTTVSSRVFMATPQVPRMLESLNRTYQQFLERVGKKPATPDVEPGDSIPPLPGSTSSDDEPDPGTP